MARLTPGLNDVWVEVCGKQTQQCLFCFADTHLSCVGTAIETPTKVTVRLTVHKDKSYVQTPHYRIAKTADESGEFYGTTGVGPGTLFNMLTKDPGKFSKMLLPNPDKIYP